MKNGDETEGRNKSVEEWLFGESFTTNISSLAQDVPGSQTADDWDSKIALFSLSCLVICSWTPLGVGHGVFGLTQM